MAGALKHNESCGNLAAPLLQKLLPVPVHQH